MIPPSTTRTAGSAAPLRLTSDTTATSRDDTLVQMDIRMLIWHCAMEGERFYRGQIHDTRYSFELFRRALVEGDNVAWEYVYSYYSGLVERWVRRNGAFAISGESSDYFVIGAFVKFWQAVTPERFASFDNLARLLQYLRLCTTSVVIDTVRARSHAETQTEDILAGGQFATHAPDEEALSHVEREEFWHYIDSQLRSEEERAVIYDSFFLDLTPRAIYARRSAMFKSVKEVYAVKRNVLSRLERQPQLRLIAEEGQRISADFSGD